jgi:hypothetical protein
MQELHEQNADQCPVENSFPDSLVTLQEKQGVIESRKNLL